MDSLNDGTKHNAQSYAEHMKRWALEKLVEMKNSPDQERTWFLSVLRRYSDVAARLSIWMEESCGFLPPNVQARSLLQKLEDERKTTLQIISALHPKQTSQQPVVAQPDDMTVHEFYESILSKVRVGEFTASELLNYYNTLTIDGHVFNGILHDLDNDRIFEGNTVMDLNGIASIEVYARPFMDKNRGIFDLMFERRNELSSVLSSKQGKRPEPLQTESALPGLSEEEIESLNTAANEFVLNHPPVSMIKTAAGDVPVRYVPDALKAYRNKLPHDVGIRFDAHGMERGDVLRALNTLLTKGIDLKERPLYTATLYHKDESALASAVGAVGPFSNGGFIIIGAPDRHLTESGIRAVLVNEHFYGAIPLLQERFPSMKFIRADQMEDELAKLLKEEN